MTETSTQNEPFWRKGDIIYWREPDLFSPIEIYVLAEWFIDDEAAFVVMTHPEEKVVLMNMKSRCAHKTLLEAMTVRRHHIKSRQRALADEYLRLGMLI